MWKEPSKYRLLSASETFHNRGNGGAFEVAEEDGFAAGLGAAACADHSAAVAKMPASTPIPMILRRTIRALRRRPSRQPRPQGRAGSAPAATGRSRMT